MALLSRRLYPPFLLHLTSPDDNSEDFTSDLFPLHSPLLRESWLVSFPPPSYMLKFSGYSWLIGGPIRYTPLAHLSVSLWPNLIVMSAVFIWEIAFLYSRRISYKVCVPKEQACWRAPRNLGISWVKLHLGSFDSLLKSHQRTDSNQTAPKTSRSLFPYYFLVGMNRHSNRHTSRGRCKLRSKFWWLTGFCNSHDVSHFAAFFIVVGAKTSVAESVGMFRLQADSQGEPSRYNFFPLNSLLIVSSTINSFRFYFLFLDNLVLFWRELSQSGIEKR